MIHRLKMIAAAISILVVGSIAVVVGLSLFGPQIICHLGDQRRAKAAADIVGIVEALETFRVDHGMVPMTDEGLAKLVGIDAGRSTDGYLLKIPVDPWGHPYAYSSDGKKYSVTSFGADGAFGGDGQNADLDNDKILGPNGVGHAQSPWLTLRRDLAALHHPPLERSLAR